MRAIYLLIGPQKFFTDKGLIIVTVKSRFIQIRAFYRYGSDISYPIIFNI
jgi:hypothetical protein